MSADPGLVSDATAPAAAVRTDSLGHPYLPRPPGAQAGRLFWGYIIPISTIHLLLPLGALPEIFTWWGVLWLPFGNFLFGSIGINIGYHRLITHRSFECPKWLERIFVTLGVCCLQDSPGRWATVHRIHHQFSDQERDPHSPLVNFFWGHMGWLMIRNAETDRIETFDRYSRDVMRDRYHMWLAKGQRWIWVYVVHALLIFALGIGIGLLVTSTREELVTFALRFGFWGVIARTAYVWHVTWVVNSLAHRWGYQNYDTGDSSRNNWFAALLTFGEGWHNNHHHAQRSAAHGQHRWWELDPTYWFILGLRRLKLATKVVNQANEII